MTAEGWRTVILDALHRAATGDPSNLVSLAKTLEELDQAKQCLRDAGFGVTGMGILDVAREIAEWRQNVHNPADGADGL